MFVSLLVCLFVCLFVCLLVCLFVCLFVCWLLVSCLFVSSVWFVCLFMDLFTRSTELQSMAETKFLGSFGARGNRLFATCFSGRSKRVIS